MRRRDGGVGRGARADTSHASVREAPGSRPLQLRGAALRGLHAARMKAGESPPDKRGRGPLVCVRKLRPRGQKSRDGAPRGARVPGGGAAGRKDWCAARCSIPSILEGTEEDRRPPGASTKNTGDDACLFEIGCLKIESVLTRLSAPAGTKMLSIAGPMAVIAINSSRRHSVVCLLCGCEADVDASINRRFPTAGSRRRAKRGSVHRAGGLALPAHARDSCRPSCVPWRSASACRSAAGRSAQASASRTC